MAPLYSIIVLDPVTTRHYSEFQLMWPHHRSRSSPFREWLAAFRSYIATMSHTSHNHMNIWRWDNPRAFGDQGNCTISQSTSLGKVKCTGEHFSLYGTNDFRVNLVLPSRQPFKPGDFLTVRPLKWNEIINKDDDAENWADHRAPRSGRNRHGDGNQSDDGEGDEDMQGGQKRTGK
jgi:hypothetical protein